LVILQGCGGESSTGPTAISALATFDTNYGSGSGVAYAIRGAEPATEGGYPVFIYTVGTFGTYDATSALAWIDYIASRGFVAATVEYPNGPRPGCPVLHEKAAGIYSGPDSAIAVLCNRARANCLKGIVTAGHSQGSAMAMLAADYDSRVRAALALGTGFDLVGPGLNYEACLVDERVLPPDAVRAVNGESDATYGSAMSDQLNLLTGMNCAAGTTCLRANGSGWVLAPDDEATDGLADHCYMGVVPSGESGSGCLYPSDPVWLSADVAWGRKAGADFLQAFVDR
jgi:pimeloyl-ACP methyl ester carboxylesterase